MTPAEFDPLASENGDFAYGGLVAMVVTRVRLFVHRLEDAKAIDGLLACVFALRVMAEAAPSAARDSIATGEVEAWQEKCMALLETKKLPKRTSRAAIVEYAEKEFAALKKFSFPTPRSIWQSHLQMDILRAAKIKELDNRNASS